MDKYKYDVMINQGVERTWNESRRSGGETELVGAAERFSYGNCKEP